MASLTQFSVIIFDDKFSKAELAELGTKMKESMEKTEQDEHIQFNYRGNIRQPFEEEQILYDKSGNLEDFDTGLEDMRVLEEYGKYNFVLLPKSCKFNPGEVLLRYRRTVYMTIPADLNSLFDTVKKSLEVHLVGHEELRKTVISSKGILMMPDKASMRSVKSHPGYQVTFTLLNPQPDMVAVEWDIKEAIQAYLQPFLDQITKFTEITIKSQYLHFTGLHIRPEKNKETKTYNLKQDALPHIINPIEAELGSHVSVNPQLNFILYVPEQQHSPLQILNSNDEPSLSNSFLSPRWGGIMVYNTDPPPENSTLPHEVKVDMRKVMEVFLSQLRLLLGVTSEHPPSSIKILPPGNNGINLWELDHWMRKRTVENIATATATVRSLVQLLDKVKNIVINDQIGNQVHQAVDSIEKSHNSLSKSKLKDAYLASRKAIAASEKAFFDPSLLELLYFPEDQKFAIYIPLFLPISIPVVMSLLQAFKWFKNRNNEEKLKTE